MINLPLGLSLCFTSKTPTSPAHTQEENFSPVSNTIENAPIYPRRATMMKLEKPKDTQSSKHFLNPRIWWADSTANIPPSVESDFGKVKALVKQTNDEDVEADEFLELSRPSSRLNTREDQVTSNEPSFAEVCHNISQRFDHSMKMCQPALQAELKKMRFSEIETRKGKGSLLPSGFKTPPRKSSIHQFHDYRSQVFSPSSSSSSSSSRSRSLSSSSSRSPSSSETSSGLPHQFHTPENKIDPHRRSFEEEDDILDYYLRSS